MSDVVAIPPSKPGIVGRGASLAAVSKPSSTANLTAGANHNTKPQSSTSSPSAQSAAPAVQSEQSQINTSGNPALSYRLGRGALTVSGLLGRLRSDNPVQMSSSVATGVRVSAQIDISGDVTPYQLSGIELAQGDSSSSGLSNQAALSQDGVPASVDEQPSAGDVDETRAQPLEPETRGEGESADSEQQADQANDEGQSRQQMAEQQELSRLKARDQEVKSHERAHAAVGGHYANSPSYKYETGSDGRRYAVSGEVEIDITPIPGDPQATINKMQKVYAAAMAPVNPSMADIQVANEAMRKISAAKQELAAERQDEVEALQDTLGKARAESEQIPALEPKPPQLGTELDQEGIIRQATEADSAIVVPVPDSQRSNVSQLNQSLTPGGGTDFFQGTVIAPPTATLQGLSRDAADLEQARLAIAKRYGLASRSSHTQA